MIPSLQIGQLGRTRFRHPVPVNSTALSIYNKIVAWWALADTSGTTAVDSHTNGLNGTYTNATLNQSAIASGLGVCASFSSGNGSVLVPHNALLSLSGDLACMAWHRRGTHTVNFPKLLWKQGTTPASGHANYMLQANHFDGSDRITGRCTRTDNNSFDVGSAGTTSGVTYHTLLSRTGSTIRLYHNGTNVSNDANVSSVQTTTNPLYLAGSGSDGFNGYLSNCAVFNDDLSQTEVDYLYNSGNGITYAALKAAAGL